MVAGEGHAAPSNERKSNRNGLQRGSSTRISKIADSQAEISSGCISVNFCDSLPLETAGIQWSVRAPTIESSRTKSRNIRRNPAHRQKILQKNIDRRFSLSSLHPTLHTSSHIEKSLYDLPGSHTIIYFLFSHPLIPHTHTSWPQLSASIWAPPTHA